MKIPRVWWNKGLACSVYTNYMGQTSVFFKTYNRVWFWFFSGINWNSQSFGYGYGRRRHTRSWGSVQNLDGGFTRSSYKGRVLHGNDAMCTLLIVRYIKYPQCRKGDDIDWLTLNLGKAGNLKIERDSNPSWTVTSPGVRGTLYIKLALIEWKLAKG